MYLYAQCTICLETLGSSTTCTATRCGHFYHRACIEQCLAVRPECPQCRARLTGPLALLPGLYANSNDVADMSFSERDLVADTLRMREEIGDLKTQVQHLRANEERQQKRVSELIAGGACAERALKQCNFHLKMARDEKAAHSARANDLERSVAQLREQNEQLKREAEMAKSRNQASAESIKALRATIERLRATSEVDATRATAFITPPQPTTKEPTQPTNPSPPPRSRAQRAVSNVTEDNDDTVDNTAQVPPARTAVGDYARPTQAWRRRTSTIASARG